MRLAIWIFIFAVSLSASDLTLHLQPRWRGAPMAVPSPALDNDHHQALRVTRLAALVSQVSLLRPDGSVVRLDGQFGLIDAAEGRLTVPLRNVPPGDYAGIEFSLGVPAEINHADPARWPAGHPLNPFVNRLHWNWQGGYVFLALEGRWRSSDGEERGFSYHLATDRHLMTVRFLSNFSVVAPTTVDFALDLARVLGSRQLVAGASVETTHSAADDKLADELAHATERAFFWLEATPTVASQQPAAQPTIALAPRSFTVPAGFPQPALPADNPLSDKGISLGEKLFRDPRLSGNGKQSCASCHAPERAFSDRVALSLGIDGKPGARNAQPLPNLAWAPSFAWDGSQPRVRDQALAAMSNPLEMHADPARVAHQLATDTDLQKKFHAAFGTPGITAERISLALEQYLLTLVSADAKFDRAARGEAQLTAEEQRGMQLFLTEYDPVRGQLGADCFHCHGGVLFTDFAMKNNGLDLAPADMGREKVTGHASDRAKFKTPSLRNVAVTAPYMHDGRFATLEVVVAHYDHGVRRTSTLDPNLAKHPDAGMKLSATDQRALVAFLRTLTDVRYASADYSSPSQ